MPEQDPSTSRDPRVTDPSEQQDLVTLPETIETAEDFIVWVRGGCKESFNPSIENNPNAIDRKTEKP